MNHRRPWLRRGALAATLLCSVVLGVATTRAEVTVTPTRLVGARYRLQAVATGTPCDAWLWTVLAGPDATLTPDDQATVEAEVSASTSSRRPASAREVKTRARW